MKILCLLPHVDDEMGCLPYIAHMTKKIQSINVYFVYFSNAKESCEALGFDVNKFLYENKKLLNFFKIDISNIFYLNFPVRRFPEHRQDILEEIVKLKIQFNFDTVLCPAIEDVHQDHSVICQETIRSFKNHATILGFTYPWNILENKSNFFLELNKEMVDHIKIGLNFYDSQKTRKYMRPDFIEAVFRSQGINIGTDYACAYSLIRSRNIL